MKVYFYPYKHGNRFIESTQNRIKDNGLEVLPFWSLFKFKNLISKRDNIIVLNWYEDQPYRKNLNHIKKIALYCFFLLALITTPLFSYKRIWLRHNIKPHNVNKKSFFHSCFIWAMGGVCNKLVTLESVEGIKSDVVQHPLYCSDSSIQEFIDMELRDNRTIDFLIFGMIKPYKRLHLILENWPKNVKLTILGKCDSSTYIDQINLIIRKRNLLISWKNEFIDESELNGAILNSKFVIIPNEENSMITSGAFYHAISFGANIIALKSQFAETKAKQHTFITVVTPEKIGQDLFSLNYITEKDVLLEVLGLYGESKISQSWLNILQ